MRLATRASAILAKTTGPDYPDLGGKPVRARPDPSAQRRYEEAEPLLKRSLEITTAGVGPARRYDDGACRLCQGLRKMQPQD